MKPKTHTWTEAEVEQLVRTLESMRDLDGAMTDYIKSLHDRLFIAETWIEQHKVEAAAFKATQNHPVGVPGTANPPTVWIKPPLPLVDGPNVIHHKKWADIKHKAGLKPVHDPPGTCIANIDDLDLGGDHG